MLSAGMLVHADAGVRSTDSLLYTLIRDSRSACQLEKYVEMRRVINIAENASHSSHQDKIGNGVSRKSSAGTGTGVEGGDAEQLIEASEPRQRNGCALTILLPDSRTLLHCGIALNGRPAC